MYVYMRAHMCECINVCMSECMCVCLGQDGALQIPKANRKGYISLYMHFFYLTKSHSEVGILSIFFSVVHEETQCG